MQIHRYMRISTFATNCLTKLSISYEGQGERDTEIARKIVRRSPSSQLISQTKVKQPTKDLVYFCVRIFLWLIDHDVPSRVSFVDKGIARESSGLLSPPPREARICRRIWRDWQECFPRIRLSLHLAGWRCTRRSKRHVSPNGLKMFDFDQTKMIVIQYLTCLCFKMFREKEWERGEKKKRDR